MARQNKLTQAQETLNRLIIHPRMKIVPDQVTGKTYALCIMETDNEQETRIQRHVSDYYSPELLTAFIHGMYTGKTNPYV